MGERGPVPKRTTQRRRRNKSEDVKKSEGAPLTIVSPLPANAKWHATAKRWYNSLEKSGQAVFYEESDWATAYLLAESISRELKPQPMTVGRGEDAHTQMVELPPKGASLAAWFKAMSSLLVTEGDRRRVSLELQRPGAGGIEEGDADVSDLAQWRSKLRGSAQ